MAAAMASSTPERITDVRFWTAGDTTRVAIEVSGEFTYTSQRLHDPERVFFDLEQTKLALKSGKSNSITVGDGLVKKVRLAEKKSGVIRIVLDLEDAVAYTASQLSSPERLMIELHSGKAAAPGTKSEAKPEVKPEVKEVKPEAPGARPEPKVTAATTAKAGKTPVDSTTAAVNRVIPPVFASMAGTSTAGASSPMMITMPQVSIEPAPSNEPVREPVRPLKETKEPVRESVRESKPTAAAVDLPEPKPAGRNANGERSLTRVLGLKIHRVVLDAGHGGHDQGTRSKSGLLEKDLVLDVTQRLATLLRERMGTEVVLTRTDDTYLS
ncbi:MAG: AMIN domain-containing protein [Acidobacteriota bacterium]